MEPHQSTPQMKRAYMTIYSEPRSKLCMQAAGAQSQNDDNQFMKCVCSASTAGEAGQPDGTERNYSNARVLGLGAELPPCTTK